MSKILHAAIAVVPLAAGWIAGAIEKVWVIARAAFLEGYEAGRKL